MSTTNVTNVIDAELPGATLATGATMPPVRPRRTRQSARERAQAERQQLQQEMEIPFDPAVVRWKVFQTERRGKFTFGLALPYADTRAYQDRLNALFTTEGWINGYTVSTIPTKVLAICELTIAKLGCHSATGEEWSSNENATTSAESQAFKRACACFGLGRYFYSCQGVWLQLDKNRRPLQLPTLPDWATPEGWRGGLRPPPLSAEDESRNVAISHSRSAGALPTGANGRNLKNVVPQIAMMRVVIGLNLYRGVLKDIAHAWQPADIRSIELQQKVLAIMQSASRGLDRFHSARAKAGADVTTQVMQALDVGSVHEIKDIHTLQELVLSLERAANAIPNAREN